MSARALLLLLFAAACVGCAAAVIAPDGTVAAIAVGHAAVEHCAVPLSRTSTPAGAPAPCDRIEGGALSMGAAEAVGAVFNAIVAYVTLGG